MIRSLIVLSFLGLALCQETATTLAGSTTVSGTSTSPVTIGATSVAPVDKAAAEDQQSGNGVFSRLIIANKRATDDKWGLNHDDAEAACQGMVEKIHEAQNADTEEVEPEIKTIVDRMLGENVEHEEEGNKAIDLEGHLVAIHSMGEYDMLGSFFARLPGDIYWTGGKLIRYMTNSRKNNEKSHNLVLTWTDGTNSDPYELGIDEKRAMELSEGNPYCLAFNTVNGQWQARNCSDRLPYACILQHAHEQNTTMAASGNSNGQQTNMGSTVTASTTTLSSTSTTMIDRKSVV